MSSPTCSTRTARRSRSSRCCPTILPLEDADSSAAVARSFKKRGIDIITGAKISNVKVAKGSVKMTADVGGEKKDLEAESVLVAAGRAPNVEDIGLKEAGVQLTERGFVKVNTETYETSGEGDLRDRRCDRRTDARAQGTARGCRVRRGDSPASIRMR